MAVPTPTLDDVDILTPQQLYELVMGLIIDNNIQAVTPAKARSVLVAIIAAYAGRSSNISAEQPIFFDPFSGSISIQQATRDKDGYITKEDFAAFADAAAGSSPLAALELRVLKKADGNTGGFTLEVGDLVFGEPVAGTFWNQATYNGGDPTDLNNYTVWSETTTA